MTNKKSMKRALISSLLIMAMCFTMLAGTTYAWFTDSVTSANNIIKSGKLDVEVEYYVPATDTADAQWATLTADTKLFDDDALYEPGYTQVAYIKVKNVGNLALKYKLAATIVSEDAGVNMSGEEFMLSDYLVFGSKAVDSVYASREAALAAIDPAQKLNALDIDDAGNLLPNQDSGIIALIINMPTTVGNEANYGTTQPKITLGLTVFATQDTVEADSFDNQYDALSEYPGQEITSTLADLNSALRDTTVSEVVLNQDMRYNGTLVVNGDKVIDLKDFDLEGHNGVALIANGGKVTIKGEGKISSANNVAVQVVNGGEIVINGGKIEAQEAAVMAFTGSKITINDGEFKAIDNFAVGTNGSAGQGGNTITINGGTFDCGIQSDGYVACGIYAPNDDTIIVTGGTFNIKNGAGVVVRGGKLTMSGATFNYDNDGSIQVGKVGDSRVVVPVGKDVVVDRVSTYPAVDTIDVSGVADVYEIFNVQA